MIKVYIFNKSNKFRESTISKISFSVSTLKYQANQHKQTHTSTLMAIFQIYLDLLHGP